LTIYPPRLLPASPPVDPDGTEYQYAIFLDGKRFYGIGLNGSDAVVDKDGRRERVFLLDLGPDWVLDTVLRLKHMLEDDADDFDFLRGLARGLVGVFESRTDNDDDTRYLAVANAAALAARHCRDRRRSAPAGRRSAAGRVLRARACRRDRWVMTGMKTNRQLQSDALTLGSSQLRRSLAIFSNTRSCMRRFI
jgi:hypothetical protein